MPKFLFLICLGFIQTSCALVNNGLQTNSVQNSNNFVANNLSDLNSNGDVIKNKDDNIKLPPEYFGSWGGTHGGLIEISSNQIIGDVLENKRYVYKVIENVKRNGENQYLLELKDRRKNSYLRKFTLLRFKSDEQLYYSGYESYENYQNNIFSAAGEFFKNSNDNQSQSKH
jgi:hypothetical protein